MRSVRPSNSDGGVACGQSGSRRSSLPRCSNTTVRPTIHRSLNLDQYTLTSGRSILMTVVVVARFKLCTVAKCRVRSSRFSYASMRRAITSGLHIHSNRHKRSRSRMCSRPLMRHLRGRQQRRVPHSQYARAGAPRSLKLKEQFLEERCLCPDCPHQPHHADTPLSSYPGMKQRVTACSYRLYKLHSHREG